MATHKSSTVSLRDRLLSNTPDPIKSSILRESGMGWNSPPASSDNTASSTSPLVIAKRDSPVPPSTQADLARRSSSSYKHMRNNNLVSKSPFKSLIPTPSTPSRNLSIPFPLPTRRVSGEKRPRPPSIHDQAESENNRPFSLKRERKQSKTFQGLIEKEPVTKSPFRQRANLQPSSSTVMPVDLPIRKPLPSFTSPPSHSTTGTSPVRPSLVTKRMHGPRLSGSRKERRKTVSFNERCDVVEFDRDEEMSDDVFASDEEDDYGDDADVRDRDEDADSFFEQPNASLSSNPELNDPVPDGSYESIELSDTDAASLQLDPDTSITGLVDEMFGAHQTSTPPKSSYNDLPTDLETEDGVPFGRSHHAERAFKYHHQQQDSHPHVHLSPLPLSHASPHANFPLANNTATPPGTPPHRSSIASPPLGRTTHIERLKAARQEEDEVDKDIKMLPESPSPIKPRASADYSGDGLIPKFELSADTSTDAVHTAGPDPFALPNLKDEPLPDGAQVALEESLEISRVSNVSAEISDVNISAIEQRLFEDNDRLLNTSLDSSPLNLNPSASFTRSSSPARRSPLPPIPSVPSRFSSPAIRSASPLSRNASPGSSPTGIRPRINRDDVHRRLLRQRSFGSLSPSGSPNTSLRMRSSFDQQRIVDLNSDSEISRDFDRDSTVDKDKDAGSVLTAITDNSAEMATIETAEKRKVVAVGVAHQHEPPETDVSWEVTHDTTVDMDRGLAAGYDGKMEPIAVTVAEELGDRMDDEKEDEDDEEDQEFGLLQAPRLGGKLQLDFGSKFGQGRLGISDISSDLKVSSPRYDAMEFDETNTEEKPDATKRMDVGSVNVRMDMRSALDRLMDDVASVGGPLEEPDDSMATTEEGQLDQRKETTPTASAGMQRAATDSALVGNVSDALGHEAASGSRSVHTSPANSIPPPPPPKDNIRTREAMILEKRREMRRMEEEEDGAFYGRSKYLSAGGGGRPSRRRSMSTGDAEQLGEGSKMRAVAMRGLDKPLDVDSVSPVAGDPLSDTIERELRKMEEPKKQKKYLIREREGTIYASSDDGKISHMAGPGDVNVGKAWRFVRRPSDMNEYSKQIKEYRAQEKPGKTHGKVFVKVLGIKGLHIPLPQEPTVMSCTLNNGIHFVTTPECRLGKDCRIEQEFELIEHSKLEFTLTLKVRRDPHIIAQFKAIAPPPPQPPPMVSQPSSSSSSKSSGMRHFFSSSPKKHKDKTSKQPLPPPPPPQLPAQRLAENLARYLKPDGTLARAFVSFKDIAHRCDTRLFETTFPLIGQRVELGNKFSTLQVGEIVLQLFRLPPLPGVPPDQLPQSLEECHRGLRHVNWHKMTYFEGTLTQNGGDCRSWRRRQFRVIGANLVAFNDITKRVTATINLKNAIGVEDDQDVRNDARSPASGTTSRSSRYDEYNGLYGVERSFRLIFPDDEEISFFADTDEEKARWLEVLRALVGHIPPHPLWAELLWQRQEDINKARASG